MKKSFEEEIKNRMKDIEMPYNSSAWKSINDTLDKQDGKSSSTNYIWLLSIISLIAITSLSTYLFTESDSYIVEEKSTKRIKLKNIDSYKNISKNDNSKSIDNKKIKPGKNFKTENKVIQNKNNQKNHPITQDFNTNKNVTEKVTNNLNETIENDLLNNKPPEIEAENFIPLEIPSNICLGEKIQLNNQNNIPVYINQPDGNKFEVKSQTSILFTPILSGEYKISTITDEKQHIISLFNVHSKEKLDIELEEENIYKEGLPHRLLSTNSLSDNLVWFLNDEEISNNSKSIELNLFSKGIYSIKLLSKTENCFTSSTKKIIIENDYNLLAVDAFSPLESNEKTNTFIPYALKERKVSFNFIIIDPKDGYVVYQTNDKLKPWNGVDQRTGQIVPKNSNWIWKVTIETPLKGENPNYKGIIVRI
jgi:hypothetical protein